MLLTPGQRNAVAPNPEAATSRGRATTVQLYRSASVAHAMHAHALPSAAHAYMCAMNEFEAAISPNFLVRTGFRDQRLNLKFSTAAPGIRARAMVQEAPYMIIRVSSISLLGSRCRIELLDIGGSMGTVPRQESVSNSSMRHRELLKWHC